MRTTRMNAGVASILMGAMILAPGCGFGRYNDEATADVLGANDGVANNGQWWSWACANGSNPSPATTPLDYTAAGTCGTGGALSLSVNGCNMQSDWTLFGLSEVTTNISTSIPEAGGWEIVGTANDGDTWTCDAATLSPPSKVLTLTCTGGDPAATVCTSTLTPVGAL